MNARADKTGENKSQSTANELPQKQSGGESTLKFIDNRPEAIAQRKLQEMGNDNPQSIQLKAFRNISGNSPQEKQVSQLQSLVNGDSSEQLHIQKEENKTGLPDNLKTGIENLSGMSLNDVKVHYNSDKPAQLQAHAYAKGTDIHLASGQEKHLSHEAWHVVQQKQGRVKPTLQMKGAVNVNDDSGLESEADVMGAKALRVDSTTSLQLKRSSVSGNTQVLQRVKYAKTTATKIINRRDDDYRLKSGETEVDRKAYQKYLFDELFKDKAKSIAPTVMGTAAESTAREPHRVDLTNELVYRGMSANNVANRDDAAKASVFTVQNPDGDASEVEHIVNDDPDSPYLSFEANGLGVSAGKYAHKPVDENNQSLGVTTDENGFLKQEKSYTQDNIGDKYAGKKRIGVVAGIFKKPSHVDVSTATKAKAKLNPGNVKGGDAERAVDLAVADKEILVKPGPDGIAKGTVPFYAKVETITEEEFIENIDKQTPTLALGYHKPSYYKIQIDTARSNAKFHFQFNLDAKYQNGGGAITDVPDLKINKGLFSLSTEEQDMVRDEMPEKDTELRAIGSEIDVLVAGIANQPNVPNLKNVVGPDLNSRLQDIVNWFEVFETGNIPKVEELKSFNTLLERISEKCKDFWNQILILAKLPQLETKLTKTDTFLNQCLDVSNLQKIRDGKVKVAEAVTNYDAQYKKITEDFIEIKSPIPQVANFQKRLGDTLALFTRVNELLKRI